MSSKILCTECNAVLISRHRHDFVSCGCPNHTFLDGGDDCMRVGGKDFTKIILCPKEESIETTKKD